MRVCVLAIMCLVGGALRPAAGQIRVSPENLHERALLVVPMIGAGTPADPRRPLFAPANGEEMRKAGLLSFSYELTDDGKSAVLELVARDQKAFAPMLEQKRLRQDLQIFQKGKHSRLEIEREVKKLRRDFDLEKFAGRRGGK